MGTLTLIGKEYRAHGVASVLLAVSTLLVFVIMRLQNRLADFSMSDFEIVRLMVMAYIPLLAFMIGNRLIVQEYFSRTWQFVEALPIKQGLPLLLKYFLGLSYLFLLCSIVVIVTAINASVAEDIDASYTGLILVKTLALVMLYWSIVFLYSLCGVLRIALYAVSLLIVVILIQYPGIDATQIPPIALIDQQMFVYERDSIPWVALLGTVMMSLMFTLSGITLSRMGEGSVVSRLARPLARGDFVVLGIVIFGGFALWSTLIEQQDIKPTAFTNPSTITVNEPYVSVLYLEPKYFSQAEDMVVRISDSLANLQAELGIAQLPRVQIALTPLREKHDIDYDTNESVYIAANWVEHDSYDDAILDTVTLHGVLSVQTNNRSVFEPYHWILDGFTRWWVEQGQQPIDPSHFNELMARAIWAVQKNPNTLDLEQHWQLTADEFAYPTAEALAWSAMAYIEEHFGRNAVVSIAAVYLTEPVGSSAFSVYQDRLQKVEREIQQLTGLSMMALKQEWHHWLLSHKVDYEIDRLLEAIPRLEGLVTADKSAEGRLELTAGYRFYSRCGLPENFFSRCRKAVRDKAQLPWPF